MATYSELKEQIRLLTEQAETARKEEWSSVIDEINNKIAEYQIKPSDLTFPADQKADINTDSSKNKLPPKYRHPDDHKKVWSGRGITPNWLIPAKGTDGKIDPAYLIENQKK